MTFWTIPFRLVEWEARKIKRLTGQGLPERMVEWSRPLPESEWARPSEQLKRLSQKVRDRHKANPGRIPYEIFAEVYDEEEEGALIA